MRDGLKKVRFFIILKFFNTRKLIIGSEKCWFLCRI